MSQDGSHREDLLGTALTVSRAARGHARQLGIAVAVVIVDGSGRTVSAQRMDGAYLTAETIAARKAFTAANFGRPTHEMAERLQTIEYQLAVAAADPRLTFLRGGTVLLEDDRTILGLGVSGGSGDQDLECCEAGLAAVSA